MSITPKIRIIIADDHTFFREGLRLILGLHSNYDIVAEVGDGIALVEAASKYKVDLLIVDIGMPILNGIEAVQQLNHLGIQSKVIALSMHTEKSILTKMYDAGALCILEKNTSRDDLYKAIDSVMLQNRPLFKLATFKDTYPVEITFSERELEVVKLVCEDFSNKMIADKLAISPRTVESHRTRIMEKMNVKSVAGLVAFAFSHKLIDRLN